MAGLQVCGFCVLNGVDEGFLRFYFDSIVTNLWTTMGNLVGWSKELMVERKKWEDAYLAIMNRAEGEAEAGPSQEGWPGQSASPKLAIVSE